MNNSERNTRPKVSIIMGIYNCADTLAEAIDSILEQTFLNWELIMCDDGSTDNTLWIANDYARRFPEKIIVIRNDCNCGLNYTLNHCLEYVRGEYIARMDGDDISLPERLKKENDFLDSHPEYAIVSSSMIFFDSGGDWGENQMIEIPQIRDFVFHAPFHCHAPCMIRKEAYMAVGGYTVDKRLLRFEDCNLWYKLYSKGYRGYNLQESLYKMRDDVSENLDSAIERADTIRENYLSIQYEEICKAIDSLCVYRNNHDCLLEGDPGYEQF